MSRAQIAATWWALWPCTMRPRLEMRPFRRADCVQEACQNQRLAMPKSEEDKARLWALQKHFTNVEKSWLGHLAGDMPWHEWLRC